MTPALRTRYDAIIAAMNSHQQAVHRRDGEAARRSAERLSDALWIAREDLVALVCDALMEDVRNGG